MCSRAAPRPFRVLDPTNIVKRMRCWLTRVNELLRTAAGTMWPQIRQGRDRSLRYGVQDINNGTKIVWSSQLPRLERLG
jgi:hypothetical protein